MTDDDVVEIMAKYLFAPTQRKSWEYAKEKRTLAYLAATNCARNLLTNLRAAGYTITKVSQ